MDIAGIVLVGGNSTRMGVPKLTLPFGPELLVQRVVRILGGVTGSVVVVAAQGQELPSFPNSVQIVRDHREGRGPLEGIRVGLEAIRERYDAAYITGCDAPTPIPAFIHMLVERLTGHRIAVPVEGQHYHPLAAVYRTDVLPDVSALLAAERLRPAYLFETVDTCRVPVEELRSADPDLVSLENMNRPQDYLAALKRHGFELDESLRSSLEFTL